jgi:ATP-binding cassette subfamily B protein
VEKVAKRRPKSIKAALPGIGKILHKFAPEIRKQRALISLSFVALLLETAARVLEPWPLKFIFDDVILTGFRTETIGIPFLATLNPLIVLTLLTLSIVAIAGIRGMSAYFSIVGMSLAATHVMTDIRARLYTHLQRLSLSFHSKAKTGDLITRVTYDIERLREATVTAALPLLTNSLSVIGMLGVMFWMNWELALIAASVLPLFLFSTTRMTKQIQGVARTQRRREGEMAATAAEAIGAIKVVQALSLQNMLESAFSKQNKKSLRDGAKAQQLAAGLERTVEVLVSIATALVLWRGVQLVMRQTVTPGDLLVFVNYLKVAFKPMRQLAKYTSQISKATASGERIIDLLDIAPEVRDSRGAIEAPPFRGAVQFENVSFAYEPGKWVLRHLDVAIEAGQHVALVGPSGGGKSSLVSLLLRLYDPLEGRILIDSHDLREYKVDSLRQQISVVLQDSVLFAVSVRDNIAYGSLGASHEEVEWAARLANAHDFIQALPNGYDTVLGERGATLSGGQRQRIAIARAAIRRSPIIILDEPTTGLDQQNETEVNEALDRLTRGRTTFTISHNLRAVDQSDLILYLEKGKILEHGTHAELMRLGDRYASLYKLQETAGDTDHYSNGEENSNVLTLY